METSASDTKKPIQIEIFPKRMIKPDTVEGLLNKICSLEGIQRAFIQGPRLPTKVPFGPAVGTPVHHPLRTNVHFGKTEMGLEVLVGRITLELAGKEVMEDINTICEDTLPCGFDIREGHFIQTRQTVSDYAKRGPKADPALYGLYDPKSKIESQVNLLRTNEKE